MSAPAGQAARRLAPAGAAALAGLAAGDRTEALRDRPTESEEVPLAGSWLEIGLKPGDVDVDAVPVVRVTGDRRITQATPHSIHAILGRGWSTC